MVRTRSALVLVVAALYLSGCGGGDEGGGDPLVVATTSIVGEVVTQIAGDAATVEVLMPAGTDPHEFSPSARQAARLRDADLVVANGLGFEEGLQSTLEQAEDDGVAVHEMAPDARPLDRDPHFFTDPTRLADALPALVEALGRADERLGGPLVREREDAYGAQLRQLDADITARVATVPAEGRTLVTNHESFGYFADRYGFDVLGAVIPNLSTTAAPSAGDISRLADVMREAGVRAVFAETSSPTDLAEALAAEVGEDVEVVELYAESLGEPGSGADTYVGMMRINADRIVGALDGTDAP
jgi:zinc/manganese transport system substrate-binding protein